MRHATFALVAMVTAAGCDSHAARTPALTIASVATSNDSGAVTRVDVTYVPASAATPDVDFFVARDDASGEFWRASARTVFPDGSMRFALRPERPGIYAAGDALAVRALDRGSGSIATTAPYVVTRPPDSPILNGSFGSWPHDADTPTGWLESDGSSGAFYRRTQRGRPAVEVRLSATRPDTWNALELEQDVSLGRARFRIDVRSAAACDGFKRWPRELSGVALYDRHGFVVTYCVSENVARPTVRRNSEGKQAIVVLPGRRGEWLTIDVDPARDAGDVPLGSDGGPVRIGLGLRANPAGAARATLDRSIAFANLRSE